MASRAQALLPYAEFSRIGFVNILAFRLRYFTGIITYFLNVTVYFFIWTAVFHNAQGGSIAGFSLHPMITYVSVGWRLNQIVRATSELQSRRDLVCRLLLEKKKRAIPPL